MGAEFEKLYGYKVAGNSKATRDKESRLRSTIGACRMF